MPELFYRCTDQFEVFSSRFHAMPEVDHAWDKQTREIMIQLQLIVADHKCSIRISSVFDTVFRYCICQFFLRYCDIEYPQRNRLGLNAWESIR